MGLDTVELVMEIEDEFGLSIPDEAAEKMVTVGITSSYIVEMLKKKGCASGACGSAHAFYLLREQFQILFGIERRLVRLDVPIGAFVPDRGDHMWPKIADFIGLKRERNGIFRKRMPPRDMRLREVISSRCRKSNWHGPNGVISEELVFQKIRVIVSEQMGVDIGDISQATRYVEDLGAG